MGELLHHLQALPALARVGAGEDLARGGSEDHLGLTPTDRDAVDVRAPSPPPRVAQVSPPSRLRRTPSTSMPAQMVRWSSGSTTSAVTRGMTTAGHSSASSMASLSHRWPPSRERNTADGWVPAKRVSGSAGSMARAQVCMAFIGESSRSQRAPRSSLRYTPESVPAYTM